MKKSKSEAITKAKFGEEKDWEVTKQTSHVEENICNSPLYHCSEHINNSKQNHVCVWNHILKPQAAVWTWPF